ncbi:MAG: phosphate ABC transporter, permease protein PstA, partial [Deltaproteobacteria bacterium HGW-Deltaproteobacteria-16]
MTNNTADKFILLALRLITYAIVLVIGYILFDIIRHGSSAL